MTPEDILAIVKAFFEAILKVLKALGIVGEDVNIDLLPDETTNA